MEYIDNWEPDDEDDELDEAALWKPVERRWSGYGMLSLGIEFGVKDKEKRRFFGTDWQHGVGRTSGICTAGRTTVSGRNL